MKISNFDALAAFLVCGAAVAAPVTYNFDPSHTFPAFEADHLGGVSKWRGKINKSAGKAVLDRTAKSGMIEVTMDMASIDFGHGKMNEHAKSVDILNVEKFPAATYKGTFSKFNGDVPAEVQGELTLHGVTKPVTLKINEFMCKPHPMLKREVCGADAEAIINRADFGVSYGINYGFKPEVKLLISVEAIRAD